MEGEKKEEEEEDQEKRRRKKGSRRQRGGIGRDCNFRVNMVNYCIAEERRFYREYDLCESSCTV